jgi:hypothetical protein
MSVGASRPGAKDGIVEWKNDAMIYKPVETLGLATSCIHFALLSTNKTKA